MNQRDGSRNDTTFHTSVRDAETGQTLGRVVNISQDGLAIARKETLTEGLVLQVVMELPYRIEGHTELSFRAQVRWAGPGVNADETRVGLFILDDDSTRRRVFEELRLSSCFST